MKIEVTQDDNKNNNPVLRRVFCKVELDNVKELPVNGLSVYSLEGEGDHKIGRLVENPTEGTFIVTEDYTKNSTTKEQHEKFAKDTFDNWNSVTNITVAEDIILTKFDEDTIEVSTLSLDPPEGYAWLGSVFQEPEDQMRYEEFLEDPIMLERFEHYCDVKKIVVKGNDVRNSIHVKDTATNELLVLDYVVKQFQQYMFSNNFLLGFDKKSYEYELGKVMRLSARFCDYVFNEAIEAKANNTEMSIHETFDNELQKAIKDINKNPYLLNLYINDLQLKEETNN